MPTETPTNTGPTTRFEQERQALVAEARLMLGDWDDSGELHEEMADRMVELYLGRDDGFRMLKLVGG